MSWFIFTRDISANLSLFSKKKKKLLQLRQNDPFSVQKLGHILNLTQKIEKLYLFIYIFNFIYIIKKIKIKKAHKSCMRTRARIDFSILWNNEKLHFIIIIIIIFFFDLFIIIFLISTKSTDKVTHFNIKPFKIICKWCNMWMHISIKRFWDGGHISDFNAFI